MQRGKNNAATSKKEKKKKKTKKTEAEEGESKSETDRGWVVGGSRLKREGVRGGRRESSEENDG